jgi:catalase
VALSIEKSTRRSAATRKVAILCAAGVDGEGVKSIQAALKAAGVDSKIIAKHAGELSTADGSRLKPDKMFLSTASVEYDAVLVPGGQGSIQSLAENGDAIHFLNEAYRHCRPIAAAGEGVHLLAKSQIRGLPQDPAAAAELGVVIGRQADEAFARKLVEALARHRFWNRESKDSVPA